MNRTGLPAAFVAEITQIEWHDNLDRTRSHIALMNEFLRRVAIWARSLDCVKEWPFFDVAQHINPEIRASSVLCAEVDDYLRRYDVSSAMRKSIISHLNWLELLEHGLKDPSLAILPSPYEPVIVMFKRGGYFWIDSMAIVVGVTSMVRKRFDAYIDFPGMKELTDQYLDTLDIGS